MTKKTLTVLAIALVAITSAHGMKRRGRGGKRGRRRPTLQQIESEGYGKRSRIPSHLNSSPRSSTSILLKPDDFMRKTFSKKLRMIKSRKGKKYVHCTGSITNEQLRKLAKTKGVREIHVWDDTNLRDLSEKRVGEMLGKGHSPIELETEIYLSNQSLQLFIYPSEITEEHMNEIKGIEDENHTIFTFFENAKTLFEKMLQGEVDDPEEIACYEAVIGEEYDKLMDIKDEIYFADGDEELSDASTCSEAEEE